VGPVNKFHVLPTLSLRPLMLTGSPFHKGWVDTKAISVEAPTELNSAVVWVASGVVFMYPVLPTTTGLDVCAEIGTDNNSPSDPTANNEAERKRNLF
jgi:hypothetical protein